MISELGYSVDQMEMSSVKAMVKQLKSRGADISLEDRIKLYFGLLKMNYLDGAMFQMQMIYNEIKETGLSSDFVAKHPDLKIQLMAEFDIWEDSCGRIHITEGGDDCGGCCSGCCGCGGCFGGLLAVTMCFGVEGLEFCTSCVNPVDGCWCYNCEDGGCCVCCVTTCEDCCNGEII